MSDDTRWHCEGCDGYGGPDHDCIGLAPIPLPGDDFRLTLFYQHHSVSWRDHSMAKLLDTAISYMFDHGTPLRWRLESDPSYFATPGP